MIPRLRLTAEEVETGTLHPDTLLLGSQVFIDSGVLLLDNVFQPALIAEFRDAVIQRYRAYLDDKLYPDALNVGDKRTMITVALESPFNKAALYANPLILPFLQYLMTPSVVLGSLGAVVALPGAQDQHIHRDHPGLFSDPHIDALIPSFAINVIVPLIELNACHGTTQVWKGSHIVSDRDADLIESQQPVVPVGSCMLMDYRLRHGGTANRSSTMRPILYVIYHRPWFKDYVNFVKQSELSISQAEYENVPEPYRPWFSAYVGR